MYIGFLFYRYKSERSTTSTLIRNLTWRKSIATIASQSKGGYYPTPPEQLKLLCNHLHFNQEEWENRFINLIDPCCGQGEALRQNLTKINPNDTYLGMLENGYGGSLTKGQTVSKYTTATTALADDTVNGITTRIAKGQRLVALPIVDSMGDNSPTGKILGFAVFQLEKAYKQSASDVYVTGTFVQAVLNGQGGGTGTNYGAWAYQLSLK